MENSATILGAGHVGCAMAVDFVKRKQDDVMLYAHPENLGNALAIQKKGSLVSTGQIACTVKAGGQGDKLRITTSMTVAVNFSKFIFLTVPAYGYDDILTELTENDLSEHLLTLIPGNLSALVVFLAFMRIEPKFRPRFVLEASSSAHACRAIEGEVHVFGIKGMVHIAALPVDLTPDLRQKMDGFFPKRTEWAGNVLEIDFLCVNPVVHAFAVIMYAELIIETGGDFLLYHNMPDKIIEAIEEADKERQALAIKYSGRNDTLLQIANNLYGENYPTLKAFFRNSRAHALIKGPSSLDNRMFKEEIHILAGWIEFAALAGINCPRFKWAVDREQNLLKKSYAIVGRTLENLNISGLSSGEICDIYKSTQEKLEEALILHCSNKAP